MKITKESIIGDVLDYNPGTAKFFFEIGIFCSDLGRFCRENERI